MAATVRQVPDLTASTATALPRPVADRQRHVVTALLPFAVMAAVIVADILAGPALGFLPLLALGPAFAAVALSPARTALVGAVAAVACVPLADYDHLLGTRHMAVALATIAGISAAGMVASAGRGRRERELADIKAVAEAAQVVLLRPLPDEIGSIRLGVRYVSASAAAQIGGDLYEVIVTGQAVRLIVADVQGHGLAAVQTAAVVLGAFREAAYEAADLAEIAARIEISLGRHLADEEFVTAVLAEIPAAGTVAQILNCGHPAPLLVSAGTASFAEPSVPALPLGLSHLAPSARVACPVSFRGNDRLLFYTDGISEARDGTGAFYPLHLRGALLAGRDLNSGLDVFSSDVVSHAGGKLRDDAAMLLIGRGEPLG
ncbi:MAG TPA: PP2C family protein-serine/threonine phosphatase [Streptosporangiaceae bacterium]|nr:PP2C family protein-serine/threonine phosphatase [Streptosporangiaceae bacterium]